MHVKNTQKDIPRKHIQALIIYHKTWYYWILDLVFIETDLYWWNSPFLLFLIQFPQLHQSVQKLGWFTECQTSRDLWTLQTASGSKTHSPYVTHLLH